MGPDWSKHEIKEKNEVGKIYRYLRIFFIFNQTKKDPDPHKSAAHPKHCCLVTLSPWEYFLWETLDTLDDFNSFKQIGKKRSLFAHQKTEKSSSDDDFYRRRTYRY